jgi:hypothetical protein
MIFDCEGNSLTPTKFHCLSYNEGGNIVSLTTYDDMRKWLLAQKVLIGHNIIRWDVPNLERVLGIEIKAKLVDTLALSWYIYPEQDSHGLEEWGEQFGIPKPPIIDWENEPLEVYVHRCEEDVKINSKLWDKIALYLSLLYSDSDIVRRDGARDGARDVHLLPICSYLTFKMDCAAEQENSRWKINKEKCQSNLNKLEQAKEEKESFLLKTMPLVPDYVERTPPAKPFKKDGTLSTHGVKWKILLDERGLTWPHTHPISVVRGYKVPNPSSPVQVKDWLFSLGWKPRTFKEVKDEDGNVRKIPQVKRLNEPDFCDSVKELYEIEPNLEYLEGLSIINHRIGLLKGFLEKSDEEGFVKAEIGGLTNTLRFKHVKPCVNLPGVARLYGQEVRECLIAREGYELCGSDMSSLEDATKRHYMYDLDPDYVIQMSTPGYDPHLDLALTSGAIDEERITFYKTSKPEELGDNAKAEWKAIKKIRDEYKTTNYGAIYGIGVAKLSRDLGITPAKAKKLLDTYWERNWSVRELVKTLEVKTIAGQKWLLNPVSKFYYSLRYDKDKFSTLNQSTGVYCFDKWIAHFRSQRPQLTAQFHDEVILEVKKGNQDKARQLLTDAIDKLNDELKLNVTLKIDIKFGDDYAEIH